MSFWSRLFAGKAPAGAPPRASVQDAGGGLTITTASELDAALRETYAQEDELAGRKVLVYATRFPLMLVVVFGIIFLYFRSKGGYKPIELTEADD